MTLVSSDEKLNCEQCDFHTEDINTLEKHIESHGSSCSICSATFGSKKESEEYRLKEHEDKEETTNTENHWKECKFKECFSF